MFWLFEGNGNGFDELPSVFEKKDDNFTPFDSQGSQWGVTFPDLICCEEFPSQERALVHKTSVRPAVRPQEVRSIMLIFYWPQF